MVRTGFNYNDPEEEEIKTDDGIIPEPGGPGV